MDPNLFGIFAFVLIAGSIALAMAHVFHRRTVMHEERKLELQARIEEAKANQAVRTNENQEQLEHRLRVIERIITDPSSNLSRQIEDLRDSQLESN